MAVPPQRFPLLFPEIRRRFCLEQTASQICTATA